MDPQQSWSHHKVLAEEFCLHDERVRLAEEALREAQMHRSRSLAAFAVTVGRDRSVADLLGLQEREVRSARREVGKTSARIVAGDLLDPPSASDENSQAAWSGDQDAALANGWNQGVDLHVLAAQIGIDVTNVVDRLKDLSTQGLLRGHDGATTRGRHRKRGDTAGSRTVEATPRPHPRQQSAGREPGNQEMTESWAAWETQLSHDSYNSVARVISGVVLEGEVCSPSRYDHY
ncbi:hypothetical protein ACIO8G_06970 [Streptomyces sp. NPDC087219]|uniref:hypothetical protein n=1 Tax=unclassified Streptomyces TaxID=2593676 RepID=UPI0037FF60B1